MIRFLIERSTLDLAGQTEWMNMEYWIYFGVGFNVENSLQEMKAICVPAQDILTRKLRESHVMPGGFW